MSPGQLGGTPARTIPRTGKTPRSRLTLRPTHPAYKRLTFPMRCHYNVVQMGTRTEMGLALDVIETSAPWSRQCKLGVVPLSNLLICSAK